MPPTANFRSSAKSKSQQRPKSTLVEGMGTWDHHWGQTQGRAKSPGARDQSKRLGKAGGTWRRDHAPQTLNGNSDQSKRLTKVREPGADTNPTLSRH